MKIHGASLHLRETFTFEKGDEIVDCDISHGRSADPAIVIPASVVESGNYKCDDIRINLKPCGSPNRGLVFLGR